MRISQGQVVTLVIPIDADVVGAGRAGYVLAQRLSEDPRITEKGAEPVRRALR